MERLITTPPAKLVVLTPDTNRIFDGGDMTRVLVSPVDSSGRSVRSRADSISMSASGAGLFIGERDRPLKAASSPSMSSRRTAWPDNCPPGKRYRQYDHYAGKYEGQRGIGIDDHRCQEHEGVRSPGLGRLGENVQNCYRQQNQGTALSGKNVLMSVYDLSGKLLY